MQTGEIEQLREEIRRLQEQVDRNWSAQFAGYPGFD